MPPIKLRARVGPDGTLNFQLPETHAGADAELIVQDPSTETAPPLVARRASDVRLRRQQDALVTVARSPAMHAGDVPGALRLLTEVLAQAMEVERVSVWLFDRTRAKIRCADVYTQKTREHAEGDELSAAEFPAFFAALDGEQLITAPNTYTDPRTRDLMVTHLRPHGVTALLGAPIRLGGQSIGVLRCEHVGAPRLWHVEDQNFAVFMAHTVSLAMETGERLRTEAAMERSHALLMATLESTAEGVVAVDRADKLTSFNTRFVEMWKIPDAVLLGSAVERAEFLAAQTRDREGFLARVAKLRDEPRAEGFDTVELNDGRTFEWTSKPQNVGDEPVGRVWSFRDVTEARRVQSELRQERETAEKLLLNILPAPVAERLKRNPGVIADGYEDATVLFADIVDFTPLASSISPHELVVLLNEIFSGFDRLAGRHGVEKIKTIGDNYMAACGLPSPRSDHATAMAEMALDMREEFARFCERSGVALRLRIGLHSGPLVAGVIGIQRFIYDLWGETVNVASRMESQGIPGKIQVSEATRKRVVGPYVWVERGTLELKGIGEMRAYLLEGREG